MGPGGEESAKNASKRLRGFKSLSISGLWPSASSQRVTNKGREEGDP